MFPRHCERQPPLSSRTSEPTGRANARPMTGSAERDPGPICGRPPWHKRFGGLIGSLASICPACWCGRFGPLAKMVSATRAPINHATWVRPMGPTGCLAPRIDRSYHLLPLAAPARRTRSADPLGGSRGCSLHPCTFVTPSRHHQLPGDAGILVGERHGCEFRRLALEQGHQPG